MYTTCSDFWLWMEAYILYECSVPESCSVFLSVNAGSRALILGCRGLWVQGRYLSSVTPTAADVAGLLGPYSGFLHKMTRWLGYPTGNRVWCSSNAVCAAVLPLILVWTAAAEAFPWTEPKRFQLAVQTHFFVQKNIYLAYISADLYIGPSHLLHWILYMHLNILKCR